MRPMEVGTDVSNSLETVGRDERRCLSYPMTQIACVLMTTRTRHFVPVVCLLELGVAVGFWGIVLLVLFYKICTVSKIYLLTGVWKVFLLFILF